MHSYIASIDFIAREVLTLLQSVDLKTGSSHVRN